MVMRSILYSQFYLLLSLLVWSLFWIKFFTWVGNSALMSSVDILALLMAPTLFSPDTGGRDTFPLWMIVKLYSHERFNLFCSWEDSPSFCDVFWLGSRDPSSGKGKRDTFRFGPGLLRSLDGIAWFLECHLFLRFAVESRYSHRRSVYPEIRPRYCYGGVRSLH